MGKKILFDNPGFIVVFLLILVLTERDGICYSCDRLDGKMVVQTIFQIYGILSPRQSVMSEKIEQSALHSEIASSLLSQSGNVEKHPLSKKDKKTTVQKKLIPQLDLAQVARTVDSEHLLFSPMHYEPGYAYPLLIWLHGKGSDERQLLKLMPLISMRNFVGIAPRGFDVSEKPMVLNKVSSSKSASFNRSSVESKQYHWNSEEEDIFNAEQKVFDCIDFAKERCHIASSRIFLAGFDDGGSMALRLGLHFPEYFAGIISLGGRFPSGNIPFRQWTSIRHLPMMFAIGKESVAYSPEDACLDLKLLHTAGLSVSARQYPCAQEIHPEMLHNMNRWMMNIVCK